MQLRKCSMTVVGCLTTLAAVMNNNLANAAMYPPPVSPILETIEVPATYYANVTTTTVLEENQLYYILAEGTYRHAFAGQRADAEWEILCCDSSGPWNFNQNPGHDLLINNVELEWWGSDMTDPDVILDFKSFIPGVFSTSHKYWLPYVGQGTALKMSVFDVQYGDNSGSLTASLYRAAELVPVFVDIKPGSCENPLNLKDKGVLPVALLGTEDFDVTTIDPVSIRLEGIAPLRSDYKDVSAPVVNVSGECEGINAGPDGFVDLILKFKAQEIVTALPEVNDGDQIELIISGEINEYTKISGSDYVLILKKDDKGRK
jgi:hypothetical protein